MKPLVSVLIPVYNAARYLESAVNSIRNQTYTNLQIVVVNDCSNDGSLAILRRLAEEDTRVSVLSNPRNLGIVATLNFGLGFCKGKYVARMDADDIAMPERILHQVNFLESNTDYSLVGVNNVSFDDNGLELSQSRFPESWSSVRRTIHLSSPVSHNWLCRRSLYEELYGYRNIAPGEDYDFVYRCADLGNRIANIPFVGMKIRIHQNGITGLSGLRQQLAFRYVNVLHRQRVHKGTDDFTRSDFLSYLEVSENAARKYQRAYALLIQSFRAREPLKKVWLTLRAALGSFFVAAYLCRRLEYHFYLRFIK